MSFELENFFWQDFWSEKIFSAHHPMLVPLLPNNDDQELRILVNLSLCPSQIRIWLIWSKCGSSSEGRWAFYRHYHVALWILHSRRHSHLGAKLQMNISAANSPVMDFAEFAMPSALQKITRKSTLHVQSRWRNPPLMFFILLAFSKVKVKKHVQADFRAQKMKMERTKIRRSVPAWNIMNQIISKQLSFPNVRMFENNKTDRVRLKFATRLMWRRSMTLIANIFTECMSISV